MKKWTNKYLLDYNKDSSMMHKYVVFRKPENLLFGLSINFIHNFFKNGKISNSFRKIILSDINRFEFLKTLILELQIVVSLNKLLTY